MLKIAAAFALATLAFAAEASAELRMTVETDRTSVVSGAGGELAVTVRLTATGQDERFALGERLPRFESSPGFTEGTILSPLADPVVIEGPATFTGGASVVTGTPICGLHGDWPGRVTRDVLVPAQTTSLVRFTYRITRQPLWRNADVRVGFTADPRTLTPQARTLAAELTAESAPLRVTGRRGVRVALRFAGHRGHEPAVLDRDRAVLLGTLDPPVADAPVRIYQRHDATRVWRTVRTDERGRFRLAFEPKAGYQPWAAYTSRDRRYASGRSCPLLYRLED